MITGAVREMITCPLSGKIFLNPVRLEGNDEVIVEKEMLDNLIQTARQTRSPVFVNVSIGMVTPHTSYKEDLRTKRFVASCLADYPALKSEQYMSAVVVTPPSAPVPTAQLVTPVNQVHGNLPASTSLPVSSPLHSGLLISEETPNFLISLEEDQGDPASQAAASSVTTVAPQVVTAPAPGQASSVAQQGIFSTPQIDLPVVIAISSDVPALLIDGEGFLKVLMLTGIGGRDDKEHFIKAITRSRDNGYKATIGVDFRLFVMNEDDGTSLRFQLWDIAGREQFGNMTRVSYRNAHFALFFGGERSGIQHWMHEVEQKCANLTFFTVSYGQDNAIQLNPIDASTNVNQLAVKRVDRGEVCGIGRNLLKEAYQLSQHLQASRVAAAAASATTSASASAAVEPPSRGCVIS